MSEPKDPFIQDNDPKAESRKKDHIDLAFRSQVLSAELDPRFYYEPILTAHPKPGSLTPFEFLGKTLRVPMWVSSMTGGTQLARKINQNLARVCAEFGMGMGLGSCRSLLSSDKHKDDFDVRSIIGDALPLYANLGIAQVEQLLNENKTDLISGLVYKLRADGLIIHVNPLQEWLQPEGDLIHHPPFEIIQQLLETIDVPLIVKEVGQGFGPGSLEALLSLPLAAIDFAANGGTNFSRLELFRSDEIQRDAYTPVVHLGHSAEDMVKWTNAIVNKGDTKCREIIISGGIRHFLDGYYLTSLSKLNAIYGQASGFLKFARADYDILKHYTQLQIRGLELAQAFLKIRV